MKKKAKSTYEEFIEDDEQQALLDKEYKELLLSELLIAAMEHDHISVRKLASAAGVSPTIIQGLKSGSKTNIKPMNAALSFWWARRMAIHFCLQNQSQSS